jgi:flagellar biosynthesis protein FlhA
MNPGTTEETLNGLPTTDPAFGLQSFWITSEEKEKSEMLGYTVVDCISVLTTHLQEVLKKNFDKILSRQEVKQLLENIKKDYPAVVEEVNPEVLNLGMIQKVLQNLLKENIPIKDFVHILEALIDYSKTTKNVDVLTEYVRHTIGETISTLYKDSNGIIHAVVLNENLESAITKSLQAQKDNIVTLGLSPTVLRELNAQLQQQIESFSKLGYPPILITSATIRPYFYRLVNSSFPDLNVLSFTELPANIELEFIGKLEVQNAS